MDYAVMHNRDGLIEESYEATRTEPNTAISLSWSRCLQKLERSLDPQIVAAYFRIVSLTAIDRSTSTIYLAVPSRFVLSHLDRNYRSILEEALKEEFSLPHVTLRLEAVERRHDFDSRAAVKVRRPKLPSPVSEPIPQPAPALKSDVNPRYTFSSFVVGNSNQFCHAAALGVAQEPGKTYNPLFIYGGVGLGKTHLLHAIGNFVLAANPSARVLYISSETFTNELIQALRNGKMDEFKSRIRSVDVLLIDDIQFICGKERTQEEFFHTFNTLYSAHHQIVLTSDKIPQEIPGIEERLQTRFSWGLTADIQAPDFETRVAILNRKASNDGFALPEDVGHFIAEKVSSNVRELEGALTRLHALSSLQRAPLSMDLARNALKPFLHRSPVRISSEEIKKAVAQHFGLKLSEMLSKRRTKSISFPRHVAMYLCRKHTTLSYPEIGGEFGGRDHSSVIHAAQVVSQKLEADPAVRSIIVDIEKNLLG